MAVFEFVIILIQIRIVAGTQPQLGVNMGGRRNKKQRTGKQHYPDFNRHNIFILAEQENSVKAKKPCRRFDGQGFRVVSVLENHCGSKAEDDGVFGIAGTAGVSDILNRRAEIEPLCDPGIVIGFDDAFVIIPIDG